MGDLAEVGVTCPGWRAWPTRDGLAARKGGTPPGVQARGSNLAELVAAIGAFDAANLRPMPLLRRNEAAVLAVLDAAARPMTARQLSDASGVPASSTTNAIAVLRAHGLITRRRKGRVWRYCRSSGRDQRSTG
jgi:DNA-binding transcriptional ArsR family regulator